MNRIFSLISPILIGMIILFCTIDITYTQYLLSHNFTFNSISSSSLQKVFLLINVNVFKSTFSVKSYFKYIFSLNSPLKNRQINKNRHINILKNVYFLKQTIFCQNNTYI